MCAYVERAFLVITQIIYRGVGKNTNWLLATCGLTNLYFTRRISWSAPNEIEEAGPLVGEAALKAALPSRKRRDAQRDFFNRARIVRSRN